MLYPSSRVPEILAYLNSVWERDHYPLDIALRDFLRYHTKLKGFLVEGDFFRHVGFYSSLHEGHKGPRDFYIP